MVCISQDRFCLHVGIGDLIVCKSQMLQCGIPHIFVSPNRKIAEKYRSPKHWHFIFELMKAIYVEPVFTVTDDQSYPRVCWEFFKKRGVKPKRLDLSKQLCNGHGFNYKYVALNTKVRGMKKEWFLKNVTEFRKALKSINYRLVLIGEREIGMNPEYKNITIPPFSLYEFVQDLADVDLTVPELGITVPNINDFRQKCSYLRDAHAVINVGHGGNVTISCAVNDQTINLFGERGEVGSMWFARSNKKNLVTYDIAEFKERLRCL